MKVDLSRRDQYYSQRNNRAYPMVACTPTSVVMALDIEGLHIPSVPDGTQPEDYLMAQLRGPKGLELRKTLTPWFEPDRAAPNEIHKVVAACVNSLFGRPVTRWQEKATLKDVRNEIAAGHPVVISGTFCGFHHTVAVAGLENADRMMLMDPFGDPLSDYRVVNGNDVWVASEWLEQRWSRHMHMYRAGGL